MLMLRTQIIFLLLSLGSQRAPANPTTAAYSVELQAEELNNHNVPVSPRLDKKEKRHVLPGVSNWDCQAESDFIQEQISLMTKLLHDGDKVSQQQKDLPTDETILVLGKSGSGKTSLIQFLTGQPNLRSKQVRSDTGEYIIENGEKIGTSATESFTLYPELVIGYNSSIKFCDSPGFHDSRSSVHEIVSMNAMKTISSQFKKVKILLLEKHESLQYGVSEDNFINTLQHLNNFLVDIDRYKDHIVLIATKIPISYKMSDNSDKDATPELITEDMHIESIMDYLNHTESALAERLFNNDKIGWSQQQFYLKSIKLLQSLQTRDVNGKATRVNIFRRPYKSGPLKSMTSLVKNKESITKTIESLDYVVVKKDDFDFTLSNAAKIYLECFLKLTSDNYKSKVNALSIKLSEFVSHKTHNYTSFHQVQSDLEKIHTALKQLSKKLDKTKNYNEFFEHIDGFISDQNLSSNIDYNEQIQILEKYEGMLTKFMDTNSLFYPTLWTLPIRQVMKTAEDELDWYKNVNKFINVLSSYPVQKNKTEYYSTVFRKDSTTSTFGLFNLFASITGSKYKLKLWDNTKRRLELESITEHLLQPGYITCVPSSGRLIVKGVHICLTNLNSDNFLVSNCDNFTVKEVAILAVDTVFLDMDNNKKFSSFIAAPKWEVIEQRRIDLSGRPGPGIPVDQPYIENGKDGKPGLPGDNGASFLGIGWQFLNGKSLKIESNGGRGGNGANGAKGATGINGKDASEKLKSGNFSKSYKFTKGVKTRDLKTSFKFDTKKDVNFDIHKPIDKHNKGPMLAEIQVVTKDGDCGTDGEPGGLGGEQGFGGLPGDLQLFEVGEPSEIVLQSQQGIMGNRGSRGETGDRGKNGIGMICVQLQRLNDPTTSYWKCETTNTTSPSCQTCRNEDKNSSISQDQEWTTTGRQPPAPKKSPDFSDFLLDYAFLMQSHANNTIFNKVIADFREAIQRKFSCTLDDLGLLFFKKDI